MAQVQQLFTADELAALAENKATETKNDAFNMKVFRKRPGQAFGNEHIATLNEVTVRHVTAIETWLPQLVGGGQYEISIFHISS